MLSNDITFIYIVGGDDSHYDNLKTSIQSVRKIYPNSYILIGDMDSKFIESPYENIEVIKLNDVKIDKNKVFKHIIWKYKYYVSQMTKTKYNLYLDTDTVLVNNLDNLIIDSCGKFTIAKHFWIPTVKDFKIKCLKNESGHEISEKLGLNDTMDFCAAGVFFFEKNQTNTQILKETFELHDEIYSDSEYIEGIYDEPLLNSVLQKNLENVIYYNGSLNHCSMIDMPLEYVNGKLLGKNPFDPEFKPVTCLHCDKSRRDPSRGYSQDIQEIIKSLFLI